MPLSDLTVLDMSRVLAGPYCTQLFADLGATVIKLEPTYGDDTRTWGPPFIDGESAYFLSVNKSKKSLAVNLKDERGVTILKSLAAKADILVENFKVGDLARYELDYDSLKNLNERLIYCSITGFGQTGPRAKEAGYDAAMQGMSGLMSITGEPNGEPVKVGVAVIDVLTGLHASTAILAALHERNRTGQGKYIDISLFEVALASLVNQAQSTLMTGQNPSRMGSAHPQLVPYQAFKAKDDYFVIAVGNDEQFTRLCNTLKLTELATHSDYASNAQRVLNRDNLIKILENKLLQENKQHWLELLVAAKVPAMPVNKLSEAFADEQTQARGIIEEINHPLIGTYKSIKSPISVTASKAPPLLGQDSQVILESLGMTKEEIDQLEEAKVIKRNPPPTNK